MKRWTTFVVTAALSFGFLRPASAAVLEWTARQFFEESVTRDVVLSGDPDHLELATGVLVEDDGPAAGHSYKAPKNQEQLSPTTWIKKELVISSPRASAAFLVVLSDSPFQALVNGRALELSRNLSGRSSYQVCSLDPQLLRAGRNDIVLHGSGDVLIARDDEFALGSRTRTQHPNRSAKSTDAGQTWDYDHLGPGGQLDGEYGVRLFLRQHRSSGSILSPVIDLGNLANQPIPNLLDGLASIQISLTTEVSTSGRIHVRARSGTTLAVQEGTWSDWQLLGDHGGTVHEPHGRFFQVAIELTTDDPLMSPRLSAVRFTSQPRIPSDEWSKQVRIEAEHNEKIVRTSIPFKYEPLDHPHLKLLRERYHLDEVVQGTKTELELMLRLAQWACNAWDWPNHITEHYPPWDALEILKPHPDGTPVGGFCQQFNLVFLQACESFGISGRAISISQGPLQAQCPGGGHEVVELWSNEWHKWVYVDGALAWYIVDDQSGEPLSLWELRDRQLALEQGKAAAPVRVVEATRTRNKQFKWSGLFPKPLNWYFELRMIPRSNFLQERSPLPLNQGTEEWAWTGHYVWSDDTVPVGLLFGHRVSKRQDFQWTLNQARFCLEPSREPGTFRVHLDTETPSFDTFLAQTDDSAPKPVVSGFAWRLHSGRNELRVWPRNVAGREGIPSWVQLNYDAASRN